jgi:hypothetical protein
MVINGIKIISFLVINGDFPWDFMVVQWDLMVINGGLTSGKHTILWKDPPFSSWVKPLFLW